MKKIAWSNSGTVRMYTRQLIQYTDRSTSSLSSHSLNSVALKITATDRNTEIMIG